MTVIVRATGKHSFNLLTVSSPLTMEIQKCILNASDVQFKTKNIFSNLYRLTANIEI